MAKNSGVERFGGNGRRSACVAYGGLVYVSGITTVNLEGDIATQARDVLGQIDRLLASAGSSKAGVLSAQVVLRSMQDYGAFNGVWDLWVDDGDEPARCVFEGALELPEYRLKISVVAAQE